MMKVILVRHGQAEDYQHPDSERQLTTVGQAQAKQTAQYLTDAYSLKSLVVSPYVRARQTAAQIVSLNPEMPTQVLANITPEDDAKTALKSLSDVETDCMVVVCHMPIVAHMAALLTGDMPESFSLAEARVFEMDYVLVGLAKEIDRFVPEQP